MFGKAVAVSWALSLVAGLILYFQIVPIRSGDFQTYEKLKSDSAAIHTHTKMKSQTFESCRSNIHKDIWTKEGRLSLKSDDSFLSIQPKNGAFVLQEESKKWEGALVDRGICYRFRADKAKYFEERVELDGHVVMTHSNGDIEADHATLTRQSLCLKTNVKVRDRSFSDRETVALADQVLYRFEEETFFLLSTAPKRVLFWQQGLSMSAPEVRIKRIDGSVEGIGDVHFSFSLEEQNALSEIFSKYL